MDKKLITDLNHKVKFEKVLDHFNLSYNGRQDRFKITCPFHDDAHPSLIIYLDNKDGRDTFWCPPCSLAGDVFLFIRLMTRLELGLNLEDKSDFRQSLETLKTLAGYVEGVDFFRKDIIRRLQATEESDDDTDTGKYYIYISGIEVRDAVKDKIFTNEFANRIFRRLDKIKERDEAIRIYKKIKEHKTKIKLKQ